jgi:hypothetical protein
MLAHVAVEGCSNVLRPQGMRTGLGKVVEWPLLSCCVARNSFLSPTSVSSSRKGGLIDIMCGRTQPHASHSAGLG